MKLVPGAAYAVVILLMMGARSPETSRSEIKVTTQLHRVGLFNNVINVL